MLAFVLCFGVLVACNTVAPDAGNEGGTQNGETDNDGNVNDDAGTDENEGNDDGGNTISVGDVLTFGSYEQDGNSENGAEAIEWQVLAVEDGRALVISKYVLDAIAYNSERADVTWETCTLRAWLNNDFYSTAFTAEERAKIQLTHLTNPANPTYNTVGGNDTEDRLFLLSRSEAYLYFADDGARKGQSTAYAKANGIYGSGEDCLWWLRSPGSRRQYAACIQSHGVVDSHGTYADYKNYGVRPAFWMDLMS